jgi:hypothetical protein
MIDIETTLRIPAFRLADHITIELPVLAVESREKHERLYVPTAHRQEPTRRLRASDVVWAALGFLIIATPWTAFRLATLGRVL